MLCRDHTASPCRLTRAVLILAALTAILSAILFGWRMTTVFSLAGPRHVVTSGWEQENIMAVWAWLHDLPVYARLSEIPYRLSLYNWLYYTAYGAWSGVALHLTGASEDWLPSAARLFTLVSLLTTTLGAWVVFRPERGMNQPPAILAASCALFLSLGPLMGFWGLTLRPDPWALALEVAAIAVFLTQSPKHPWRAVLGAVVLTYLAWAFKQSAINAAGALFLFLMVRRRFALAAVFALLLSGAAGLTIALGSESYLRSILVMDYKHGLDLPRALSVFTNAAAKTVPAMAAGAATLALLLIRPRLRGLMLADDRLVLGLIGSAVAVGLAVVTSTHPGAAENYYFASLFFLLLTALSALRLDLILPTAAFALGWLAEAALVAYALTPTGAVKSLDYTHDRYSAARPCLNALARPLFIDELYLSLPWMTPGTEPFVLAYAYPFARAAGLPFAEGGIGGLIESGYFATLVLNGPADRFDGGGLFRYEKASESCAGMTIYRRNDAGVAKPVPQQSPQ